MDLGGVVGPLDPTMFPGVVTNRFGVIPKNHLPGKWRLIVDLSHPRKQSVNDGIEPELCSLSYTSVDEAVQRVIKEGCGTVMATVNDGIEPELCLLSYTSVDEAVRRVVKEGCGTVMAKFDIESAYRLVLVHPDDR